MIGNNACGSRALGYGRTSDNVEGPRSSSAPARCGRGRESWRPARGDGRPPPGAHPHRVRPVHPAGQRLLAGAPAAGAATARPVPGGVGGHARGRPGGDRPAGRRRDGAVAGRARLPVDGRGRRRRARAAGRGWRPADRVRGAGRTDRRPGEGAGRPSRSSRRAPGGCSWRWRARMRPPWRRGVVAASAALGHRTVTDVAEQAALWRIREDGAGLAARSLRTPAYSGWEDAAVPPERLGAWLRDFDELLREHDLDGVPYGHFGDGCVHVRIDFPFAPGTRAAPKVFRDFLTASALKLREHRGSLSGEHGDGRARSELLPLMYDEESLMLFAAAKAVCDPHNLLNPGNLVDPAPLDADLRPVRPGPPSGCCGCPRRWLPGRRRAPLHRRRQVRRTVHQRRDVPVVPRHPRREGRHPGSRPGPAGGARRVAGEGPRRPGRGRGARPLPGLQGMRVRLPDRRGHGDLQGGGAAPEARRGGRTPPAQPLPARPAAPVGGPGRPGSPARERDAPAGSGRPDGPGHGRHRPAPLHPVVRPDDPAQVGGRARRAPGRLDLGRLLQRPLLPRQRARGDPLPRVGGPHRAGDPRRRVLRAHLDHDRSARRGPGDHGAHGADAAALRRVRGAGDRAGAVVPGHAAQRRGGAHGGDPPTCSASPS